MKGNVRHQLFSQRPCWPMIGRATVWLAKVFQGLAIPVRELSVMRILVTGASGQLGSYLVAGLLRARDCVLISWSGGTAVNRSGVETRPVDLTDGLALASALEEAKPDVVIHAAAISAADQVRTAPEHGWAVNVEGTRRLAAWCGERGRRLIFTSTDLVFDGSRGWYREDDEPSPVLAYGRTKAAAEPFVLQIPGGLVARLSLLYGPSRAGRASFFDRALANLRSGQPQVFFEDEFRTPLDYATAARTLIRLVEGQAGGIVHVAGRERVSRYELMQRAALALGLDPALVRANRRQDAGLAEPRPADASLDTSLLDSLLPDLDRPAIETALLTLAT
jgi:dTDP-4-dehydrorhamnose reductase